MPTKNNQAVHKGHYSRNESGVKCRDVSGQLNANLSAAFEYIYRRNHKKSVEQSILKAIEYVEMELDEVRADIGSYYDRRWMIQPSRRVEVIYQIERVLGHEKNEAIREFYRLLKGICT